MNDATHALAVHQTEALLFFTLLQLTVIVLAARAGGALARRVGQSPAVGEIIVGILLGPSLFGWLAPELFHTVFQASSPEPMQVVSQIGLVLLMFQIGLEFDFGQSDEDDATEVDFSQQTPLGPCPKCQARVFEHLPPHACRARADQTRCSASPRST